MRIRLNGLMAGPAGVVHAGAEIDIADDIALALVATHQAVAIGEPAEGAAATLMPPFEQATESAATEHAVAPRMRIRGRR